MLSAGLGASIYLSTRVTDFRKGIDGLCGEVREYLGADPLGGGLFVFYNRRRDRLKLLWWDRDGYWVCCKRLEAGTFQIPAVGGQGNLCTLSAEQLQLMLYGIDLASVRHRKRYCVAA
jgi:transposase